MLSFGRFGRKGIGWFLRILQEIYPLCGNPFYFLFRAGLNVIAPFILRPFDVIFTVDSPSLMRMTYDLFIKNYAFTDPKKKKERERGKRRKTSIYTHMFRVLRFKEREFFHNWSIGQQCMSGHFII